MGWHDDSTRHGGLAITDGAVLGAGRGSQGFPLHVAIVRTRFKQDDFPEIVNCRRTWVGTRIRSLVTGVQSPASPLRCSASHTLSLRTHAEGGPSEIALELEKVPANAHGGV